MGNTNSGKHVDHERKIERACKWTPKETREGGRHAYKIPPQQNELIGSMANIDPRVVLSEAEIDRLLESAIGVCKNGGGLIDLHEFKTAIKSERMAELSLTTILEKMGVYVANANGAFDRFKATAQRRRLMKKTDEDNVMRLIKDIISKLAMMLKREIPKHEEDEKVYNTLLDTFNELDKDGTAEMTYEKYAKAWKSLGRGGDDEEISETFDSVDVDGSGLIEWNEFAFSLMGKKAMNFGVLAQLEVLNNLVTAMGSKLHDAASQNSELRNRLEGMTEEMQDCKKKAAAAEKEARASLALSQGDYEALQKATRRRRMRKRKIEDDIASKTQELKDIAGEQVVEGDECKMYKELKDTFNVFDTDDNGELGYPEYKEAWKILEQPGDDTKIKAAFDDVDVDASGLVERGEFVSSIMGEAATKYGVLADMENLKGLLKKTVAKNDVQAEGNDRLCALLKRMEVEVGEQNELLLELLEGNNCLNNLVQYSVQEAAAPLILLQHRMERTLEIDAQCLKEMVESTGVFNIIHAFFGSHVLAGVIASYTPIGSGVLPSDKPQPLSRIFNDATLKHSLDKDLCEVVYQYIKDLAEAEKKFGKMPMDKEHIMITGQENKPQSLSNLVELVHHHLYGELNDCFLVTAHYSPGKTGKKSEKNVVVRLCFDKQSPVEKEFKRLKKNSVITDPIRPSDLKLYRWVWPVGTYEILARHERVVYGSSGSESDGIPDMSRIMGGERVIVTKIVENDVKAIMGKIKQGWIVLMNVDGDRHAKKVEEDQTKQQPPIGAPLRGVEAPIWPTQTTTLQRTAAPTSTRRHRRVRRPSDVQPHPNMQPSSTGAWLPPDLREPMNGGLPWANYQGPMTQVPYMPGYTPVVVGPYPSGPQVVPMMQVHQLTRITGSTPPTSTESFYHW